jgi:hypothetical protein
MHENRSINLVALLSFLLMTFGLTWGNVALFIFWSEAMSRIFGALMEITNHTAAGSCL